MAQPSAWANRFMVTGTLWDEHDETTLMDDIRDSVARVIGVFPDVEVPSLPLHVVSLGDSMASPVPKPAKRRTRRRVARQRPPAPMPVRRHPLEQALLSNIPRLNETLAARVRQWLPHLKGHTTPEYLATLWSTDVLMVRAIFLTLWQYGFVRLSLAVFHCRNTPATQRSFELGFMPTPWKCPHCHALVLDQDALRYSLCIDPCLGEARSIL